MPCLDVYKIYEQLCRSAWSSINDGKKFPPDADGRYYPKLAVASWCPGQIYLPKTRNRNKTIMYPTTRDGLNIPQYFEVEIP